MACASTRPQARESSTVSVASGPRSSRTVAITFSRASSKESILRRSEPGGELRSGGDDRGVAFRTGGNHADFDFELIGDEFQVVERGSRQIFGVANAFGGALPAGQRAVFGTNVLEILGGGGHFVNGSAFVAVAYANLNFALRIKDVELGHDERGDAVEHNGIAQNGKIEPSATPRPAGDGAVLLAAVSYFARIEVGHLRREWPAAHARGIGLGDAGDSGNSRGRDAQSRASAARSRVRRSDEGIGAIVNIQHGALRAFEKHRAPLVQRAIQKR